jgi:hypothetical protein
MFVGWRPPNLEIDFLTSQRKNPDKARMTSGSAYRTVPLLWIINYYDRMKVEYKTQHPIGRTVQANKVGRRLIADVGIDTRKSKATSIGAPE